MASDPISYKPTEGLSYDPSEDRYWDPLALAGEITRVFEVCQGCRMCFKYCDSFPSLFRFIDEEHDGEVRRVTKLQTEAVMDACFQCKLCEVQCPYTPREGHEFQVDFPSLVHRYKAVRTREQGVSVRDRVLGDPDGAAAMARATGGLANKLNRTRLHRWFLERFLGIHRDKDLPDFAATTFERWAQNQGLPSDPGHEAVLFQTCYVQHNEPEVGRDTVEVLQKNQVDVACPRGLECCGMPAWESGDLETLRKRARHNLDLLEPHVASGSRVLVINPTCSMTMRMEYPKLLEGEDRNRAIRLSQAIADVGEYLWSLRKEERFNTDFQSTPGDSVAYHVPCHLRAQSVGFKGRDLIRKIPGVTATTTMECCGHDGTHALKVEGFEASARIGKKAFDGMHSAEAEIWATDCPLAALQFKQHAGVRPMHPMSVLARAYRKDGFPHPVPSE